MIKIVIIYNIQAYCAYCGKIIGNAFTLQDEIDQGKNYFYKNGGRYALSYNTNKNKTYGKCYNCEKVNKIRDLEFERYIVEKYKLFES